MILHPIGDGLTLMECRHLQFVDTVALPNGLPIDTRAPLETEWGQRRRERYKRDIEKHREHIAWCELAEQSAVVFTSGDVRVLVDLVEGVFNDGK